MTVEEAIERALFGAVRDLDQFAADHKVWATDILTDPPADTYLRVDLFPNGNQRLFIKSTAPHLYLGILQLTVVAPVAAGALAARRLAEDVAAEFRTDDELTEGGVTVRIEKVPDVLRPFKSDASWNVPVSIRYQCYARQSSPGGVAMLDFSVPANSQYVVLLF